MNFCFDNAIQLDTTTNRQGKEKMNDEQEEHQLRRYKHPSTDIQRQYLLSIVEQFNVLFAQGNIETIAVDLLAGAFEAFIFSSTSRKAAQYFTGPQGFIDLYKDIRILERRIRLTDVDSDKNTVIQLCAYNLIDEDEDVLVIEVACEVFTINNDRISKYRVSYGQPTSGMDEFEGFLMPSRKDIMLAKVKELNYALAGQPDLEKVASLLNENTEYKIWRWNDCKCFTLRKSGFAESFKCLEENMIVKSIVPYEMTVDTEKKYVSGSYVYHLEEKLSGTKFVWLSTCIYGFDQKVNLTRISQQGELYPEGEVDIPFEVYTGEMLIKRVDDYYKSLDMDHFSPFDNSRTLYDCSFYNFMPPEIPNPGHYQGLKHVEKLKMMQETVKSVKFEIAEMLDFYFDPHNESHDVVWVLGFIQGSGWEVVKDGIFHMIGFSRFVFENGKLAKSLDFASNLDIPIPSPFDNKSFKCSLII